MRPKEREELGQSLLELFFFLLSFLSNSSTIMSFRARSYP